MRWLICVNYGRMELGAGYLERQLDKLHFKVTSNYTKLLWKAKKSSSTVSDISTDDAVLDAEKLPFFRNIQGCKNTMIFLTPDFTLLTFLQVFSQRN